MRIEPSDVPAGWVLLRGDHVTTDPRLDRLPTGHTKHLDRFPLTASTMPGEAVPVVLGVNWYAGMDRPVKRRIGGRDRWVIGEGNQGAIRGGHAVCLKPAGVTDLVPWWRFYDQGVEGRCVEFAWLRALTLMNRRRYDITSRLHYWHMQDRDYWRGGSYPGGSPSYEGTSVDAGAQVMHLFGAIPALPKGAPLDEVWRGHPRHGFTPGEPHPAMKADQGIAAYRWTDWAGVREATKTPDSLPGVPMLNSWGSAYPREVLLLDELGDRLSREDGEMCVPTDR